MIPWTNSRGCRGRASLGTCVLALSGAIFAVSAAIPGYMHTFASRFCKTPPDYQGTVKHATSMLKGIRTEEHGTGARAGLCDHLLSFLYEARSKFR